MKIRDFHNSDRIGAAQNPLQASPVRTIQPKGFSDVLQEHAGQNTEERLTALASDIHRQGLVLAERKDIMELKRYKKLISDFMHEAVQASFSFQKKDTKDGRGRHRMYATIQKINATLEELTQKLLSDEAENLQLMASIDDINGMLVDLII